MLRTLANIFLSPTTAADYVTIAFVLVMIVLFTYAVLRLTIPILSNARALGTAAKQLSSGRWNEDSPPFPRRFRLLNRLWQTFLGRYSNERVDVGGELVGVVRPENVFTRTQVLEGYNRRLALAFGGIFAGLGILGTFAGLFLGLLGIDPGTDDQLLSGVRQLLGGMSTAFITSIAGISFSLTWLFVDRLSYNALRRRAEQFFEAVSSRFPVRSVESVLMQSLALEVDQKAILQNLGTDLASAFQRAINEGLAAQLSPALDSIAETLETVSSRVQEQQAEALGELVGEFQEQLMASAGKQFEEFAKAVQQATEWQERVNEDVGSVFEKLGSLSEQTARLLENSTNAADRFLGSLDALRESQEATTSVATDLREVAEHTAIISAQLGAQVEVFSEANTEIRDALTTQLDMVTQQVDRLAGFWADLRERLDGLAENLRGSLLEFTNLTQEKLAETFARFDSEMAKVVQHLAGTLSEMREVTDELLPGVQRIQQSMTEALEPVRSSREAFQSLTESVGLLAPLPESIRTASERVTGTREAVDRLSEQLAAINGELRRETKPLPTAAAADRVEPEEPRRWTRPEQA